MWIPLIAFIVYVALINAQSFSVTELNIGLNAFNVKKKKPKHIF